ncbi:MAG: thioredoxin [Lachnospiraceae bacterium]|nr:thioredoxin [Lachnospiraceae bacterium]
MEMKFTGENFDAEVLEADKPVLVDFYADWCGPCKMMAPAIEKLAEEYDGKAVVGKLNVDESGEIAARYGIMNIPTLILFKNGEIVRKLVGLQNRDTLKKLMDTAL